MNAAVDHGQQCSHASCAVACACSGASVDAARTSPPATSIRRHPQPETGFGPNSLPRPSAPCSFLERFDDCKLGLGFDSVVMYRSASCLLLP